MNEGKYIYLDASLLQGSSECVYDTSYSGAMQDMKFPVTIHCNKVKTTFTLKWIPYMSEWRSYVGREFDQENNLQ